MTIRVRGDKFQVDLSYQGQRYRNTFATMAEAERWQFDTKASLVAGKPVVTVNETKHDITLEKLRDLTYQTFWAGTKGEKTVVINSQICVNYFGGRTSVADITPQRINDFMLALKATGNTGGTINRKLAALSKMLRLAVDLDYLPKMPKIHRLAESQGRERYLTEDEEAAMLANFQLFGAGDLHDLMVFLLDTGARISEATKLKWTEVAGDQVKFLDTKTKDNRNVPLTSRVQEVLTRLRQSSVSDGPFTDVSQNGRLRGIFARVKRQMGLQDDAGFVIHTMRHTCASRLVQRGIPMFEVMKWMGHKNYVTTLRYAHMAPDGLNNARNALEKDYGKPAKLNLVSSKKI